MAAASVCGVLLAGCTSEGDTEDTSEKGGKGNKEQASPSPSPSGSRRAADPEAPTLASVQADPAKLPKKAGQARDLIAAVMAGPELFGPEVVRSSPYEGAPEDWAVLDEDCNWQQGQVPDDILATRTRYYEVPAADGKGPIRLTATVTVYRTAEDADWANAGMLEEAMRCPDQQLRGGERLTGLVSNASHFGEAQNLYAEDTLSESGEYVSETLGGPYPYWWTQVRTGSVLMSVAVRSAKGRGDESTAFLAKPLSQTLLKVQDRVGPAESGQPSEPSEEEGK
ncbi:hypothetical protein LHJ74_27800 [Streptomyces sp. N2-109]|uniref:Lipoprotein n=1 Tax=Streptomyces gossypii TaxID=2883101 RepID=A0ABT2K2G9_9ACTN|nr:hypothetical protein [Streptomyces gossypii]MCT2593664.1 hypothetical protein [Streptomyces gossypii]